MASDRTDPPRWDLLNWSVAARLALALVACALVWSAVALALA